MRKLTICSIILLYFSSCSKEEEGLRPGDYLIFGYYYDCPAETCVEYFKLEGSKLYEDRKDEYPEFRFEPDLDFAELNSAKWELVKDLPEKFPSVLWETKETVFGNPDKYDQGGLYVRIKQGSKEGYWFLDKDPRMVNPEIRSFVHILNARLAMICD